MSATTVPPTVNVQDFKLSLDDDEENVIITLIDDNEQEIQVVVERDFCADLTSELTELLGLNDEGDDD